MNMRILLNLLPAEKKEALARGFHFRFFTWQTVLLIVLESFYAVILLIIFFLLNYQVQSKENANREFDAQNSEAKKLVQYEDKFKEANMLSQNVARFTSLHLEWSNLFVLLDKLVPDGVVLTDVLTKDYTVTLNGQANTRENLLAFEDRLKNADCVSDVKVPISNLFSEKEVDFQVEFNVKKECLKENR